MTLHMLDDAGRREGRKWLIRPMPIDKPRARLFCFPFAGSGASVFREWSSSLPSDLDLCLIQLPGREERITERCLADVAPLIIALGAVAYDFTDVPFIIYGHSMGAVLGFEFARYLRRKYGRIPAGLLVSGYGAPRHVVHVNPVAHLPPDQFAQRVRQYGGLSDESASCPEFLEILLPILRADLALVETYKYVREMPLECPIIAYHALEDEMVSAVSLAGWKEETNRGFFTRTMRGNHFFLRSNPLMILKYLISDVEALTTDAF